MKYFKIMTKYEYLYILHTFYETIGKDDKVLTKP